MKGIIVSFACSNKASKIPESALQYSVEGASTTAKFNTYLEGNISRLIICKMDIQLMDIIGEGKHNIV